MPGLNARHPEEWFDPIKAGIAGSGDPAALQDSDAWKAGLAYLDEGYFWECHEVLEAVWLQTPDGSAEREMVQAIIQLANARLKLRMDRPRAAARLCAMVRAHLDRCPGARDILGLMAAEVAEWTTDTETTLNAAERAI